MPESANPLDAVMRAQRASMKRVVDAYDRLVQQSMREGSPQDVLGQLRTTLQAVRDLVSASAGPLADFVEAQRDVEEALSRMAELQRTSAALLEKMAANQATAVTALETVLDPALRLAAALGSQGSERA